MTIIIVLLFFKSICLYLQNIVLFCYEKFLNPRKKKYCPHSTFGNSSAQSASAYNNQYRGSGYRSFLSSPFSALASSSSSALNKARATEREQILERIRERKRAAKFKRTL